MNPCERPQGNDTHACILKSSSVQPLNLGVHFIIKPNSPAFMGFVVIDFKDNNTAFFDPLVNNPLAINFWATTQRAIIQRFNHLINSRTNFWADGLSGEIGTVIKTVSMIVASVDIITPQKFIINGLLILAYLKHTKTLKPTFMG